MGVKQLVSIPMKLWMKPFFHIFHEFVVLWSLGMAIVANFSLFKVQRHTFMKSDANLLCVPCKPQATTLGYFDYNILKLKGLSHPPCSDALTNFVSTILHSSSFIYLWFISMWSILAAVIQDDERTTPSSIFSDEIVSKATKEKNDVLSRTEHKQPYCSVC